MTDTAVPSDCRRCGVCCFSPSSMFVRVTGADWSRLGENAEKVARFLGNRVYMRMENGHCAALEIRAALAPGSGKDFFCRIYATRPQICRDLARGSPHCEAERAQKQARALAAKPGAGGIA